MNKAEFIAEVTKNMNKVEGVNKTLTEVGAVVNQVFETIKVRLYQEDEVKIAGFATFGVRKKAARKGRNPQTGEEIMIGAKNQVFFKATKELKDYVQD